MLWLMLMIVGTLNTGKFYHYQILEDKSNNL